MSDFLRRESLTLAKELKVGYVVQVVCGGPFMLIIADVSDQFNEPTYSCTWFDKVDHLQKDIFPGWMLWTFTHPKTKEEWLNDG